MENSGNTDAMDLGNRVLSLSTTFNPDQSQLCADVRAAIQKRDERIAELERDVRAGLRKAHELTEDTQTVEEATTELVRLTRKARAERDEIRDVLLTELRKVTNDALYKHDLLSLTLDGAIATEGCHTEAGTLLRARFSECSRKATLLQMVSTVLDVTEQEKPGHMYPVLKAAHAARIDLVEACRSVGLDVSSIVKQSESIPKLVGEIRGRNVVLERVIAEAEAALTTGYFDTLKDILRQAREILGMGPGKVAS